MKKSILGIAVAVLVIATTALWYLSGRTGMKPAELVQFGVIIIVVLFALLLIYKRITGMRRGQPAEDELSKLVLQKTAAISYYISLYTWLFMIFISDRIELEKDELIGAGILAMAVIYGVVWFVVNSRGVRNG